MNNRNKILIIGQAPPAQEQELPYDTTMLYDWLAECGISKEQAQELFTFSSVSGTLRGVKNGAHMLPLKSEKEQHYKVVLQPLMLQHEKYILLGNVAHDFIATKTTVNEKYLVLIHPSRRNYSLYIKNKAEIINSLKNFINSQ